MTKPLNLRMVSSSEYKIPHGDFTTQLAVQLESNHLIADAFGIVHAIEM